MCAIFVLKGGPPSDFQEAIFSKPLFTELAHLDALIFRLNCDHIFILIHYCSTKQHNMRPVTELAFFYFCSKFRTCVSIRVVRNLENL